MLTRAGEFILMEARAIFSCAVELPPPSGKA